MSARERFAIRHGNQVTAALACTVTLLLGVVLLWMSSSPWVNYETLRPAISSVAGLLLGSIAISFLWELFMKRGFANELFTIADLSYSVQSSGLREVTTNLNSLPWSEWFKKSKTATVFVCYANTWREVNRESIKEFLSHPKNRLTIVLPSLDDDVSVADLARRLDLSEDEVKQRVNDATRAYVKIADEVGAKKQLHLYSLPNMTPHTAYYVFDDVAVMALYTHGRRKTKVPAFVASRGGDLFAFIEEDIQDIVETSIDVDLESVRLQMA